MSHLSCDIFMSILFCYCYMIKVNWKELGLQYCCQRLWCNNVVDKLSSSITIIRFKLAWMYSEDSKQTGHPRCLIRLLVFLLGYQESAHQRLIGLHWCEGWSVFNERSCQLVSCWIQTQLMLYSETCLKQPLKNRQTKVFKPCGSLMQVKSIVESREHSAILLTCIKRLLVL